MVRKTSNKIMKEVTKRQEEQVMVVKLGKDKSIYSAMSNKHRVQKLVLLNNKFCQADNLSRSAE